MAQEADEEPDTTLTGDEDSPPPAEEPVGPGQQLRLVYTGASNGIGAGRYRFDWVETLSPKPKAVTAHHGALSQDQYVVMAPDQGVASVLAFLDDDKIDCEAAEEAYVWQTEKALIFSTGKGDFEIEETQPVVATQQKCSNSKGNEALLLATKEGAGPEWEVEKFEFRLSLLLEDESGKTSHAIGVPVQEGARRFNVLSELTKEDPNSLFIDAGAFVDGTSSVRANALSLHRPVGFSMLRRLSPAALAPGETELAGGAKPFLEEAGELPYVATNWQTEDASLQLPPTLIREVNGLRVAFLGVLDPELHDWIPRLETEGVTIADPLESAQAAIDGLDDADVVVVLTSLAPVPLRHLQKNLLGADLIIGDSGIPTHSIEQLDIEVNREDDGHGVTLPLAGIGVAEIDLVDNAVSAIHMSPRPVPATIEPDAEVMAAVTRTRAAEYPALEALLLPATAEDPTAPLARDTWYKMVCESVAEYAKADLVLLPELPKANPIPGTLTELLVVDRLALLDTLEVHWIPGDRMERLLHTLYGVPAF
ncbi:MAG: hypothetical protein HN348_31345, partial [Proteobacteria bacterium]|nr:hypothetical protein [Pseudomonadota bacterium]